MFNLQKKKKKKFEFHLILFLVTLQDFFLVQRHSGIYSYRPTLSSLSSLQSLSSSDCLLPLPHYSRTHTHGICISAAEELFLWWQRLSPWSILVWHHNTTLRSERRALRLLMGRSPPTGFSTACILSCFLILLLLYPPLPFRPPLLQTLS